MTQMTGYRVLSLSREGDVFTIDNQGVFRESAQAAVEEWKEAGCIEAELAFSGDEEAVDRNQHEIYDMKADLLTTGFSHSEFFDMYAVLVNVTELGVSHLCFDIQWDVDAGYDGPGLPEGLVIHASIDDGEDELSDAVSDASGFCHKGFKSQLLDVKGPG